MTEVLRVDSEDLKLVVKDSGDCLVRIDARGWLDLDDMKNLVEVLGRSIEKRKPIRCERCKDTHVVEVDDDGMPCPECCCHDCGVHPGQSHYIGCSAART